MYTVSIVMASNSCSDCFASKTTKEKSRCRYNLYIQLNAALSLAEQEYSMLEIEHEDFMGIRQSIIEMSMECADCDGKTLAVVRDKIRKEWIGSIEMARAMALEHQGARYTKKLRKLKVVKEGNVYKANFAPKRRSKKK